MASDTVHPVDDVIVRPVVHLTRAHFDTHRIRVAVRYRSAWHMNHDQSPKWRSSGPSHAGRRRLLSPGWRRTTHRSTANASRAAVGVSRHAGRASIP